MRNLDFSSWQGLIITLGGLALVTLIGVGIRLLMMFTVQGRRERMNRQINERLRTLIAAYKVLGGSFTGTLAVDPRHLRELRAGDAEAAKFDRARRIRDAVEGALADVILLGTEPHVRLAQRAVQEVVADRSRPMNWSRLCGASSGKRWTSTPFPRIWLSPSKVRRGSWPPKAKAGAATVMAKGTAARAAVWAWAAWLRAAGWDRTLAHMRMTKTPSTMPDEARRLEI